MMKRTFGATGPESVAHGRRRRSRAVGVAAPIMIAALVAACGSSSQHRVTSAPARTKTIATTPAATPAGTKAVASLPAYLLTSGEGGFTVTPGSTTADASLAAWLAQHSFARPYARQLAADGFVATVYSGPAPSNGDQGLSQVTLFGSPAAARREQASGLRGDIAAQPKKPPSVIVQFTVAGVLGSTGVVSSSTSGGDQAAANVQFTEGSCVLNIGDGNLNDGSTAAQVEGPVVAAARALYKRTDRSGGICTKER